MAEIHRDDHRSEIVRLEEQIDHLDAKIENCRKFILSGRIAVASGGSVLIAIVAGAIRFDPAAMGLAIAAVLGGIAVAGSNRSTAKEAADELSAAEAERSALIGKLELRPVHDHDG
jgi:hypothetical protein